MSKRILKWATARSPRTDRAARYVRARRKRFIALFVTVAHIVGALTSVQAVMSTRTAQGAIAWAVSLNTIPYVAVPAYWAFGRTKFQGYVKKRRSQEEQADPLVKSFIQEAKDLGFVTGDLHEVHERLARLPITTGNDVKLLRNGDEIFPSILEGIERANDYILVQFYIVRDDALGREFQDRLIAAAERGVRVHFLYDEVGSHQLPRSFNERFRAAGVESRRFNSNQGVTNRFQINFRNHRKMVVVDGREAWVGGANLGVEYLGEDSRLSPWLDAMVKVRGPAVQTIQVAFLEDWYWSSGNFLDMEWTPQAGPSGQSRSVLCLPTGPADVVETCALYFLSLINQARQRIWIASPYFVPDEQTISALQLAAIRGVDVRIIIPENCDNLLVNLSGWSFIEPLEAVGVRFYRHTNGFMHFKATLVDDDLSAVGTANFDNRSFRLNFEITLEVRDEDFAREVEAMLEDVLADSRLASAADLAERHFLFRLAVRVARLMAPLQ